MQCTKCNYPKSEVIRTLSDRDRDIIQRRRQCLRCGRRFSTYEVMKEPKEIADDRFIRSRDF